MNESNKNNVTVTTKKDMRKAGRKCIIRSCGNSRRVSESIRLFACPIKSNVRLKWYSNCQVDNTDNKKIYVCEKHFERNCLLKRNIKTGSIPTLLLPDATVEENCLPINCLKNAAIPTLSLADACVEENRLQSTSISLEIYLYFNLEILNSFINILFLFYFYV